LSAALLLAGIGGRVTDAYPAGLAATNGLLLVTAFKRLVAFG